MNEKAWKVILPLLFILFGFILGIAFNEAAIVALLKSQGVFNVYGDQRIVGHIERKIKNVEEHWEKVN